MGRQKLNQVRQSIDDVISEFLNDYLAANPRKESARQQVLQLLLPNRVGRARG
jgi:hypothetical protein